MTECGTDKGLTVSKVKLPHLLEEASHIIPRCTGLSMRKPVSGPGRESKVLEKDGSLLRCRKTAWSRLMQGG